MPASRYDPSPAGYPMPDYGQPPDPADPLLTPNPAVAAYIARQAATVGRVRLPES